MGCFGRLELRGPLAEALEALAVRVKVRVRRKSVLFGFIGGKGGALGRIGGGRRLEHCLKGDENTAQKLERD